MSEHYGMSYTALANYLKHVEEHGTLPAYREVKKRQEAQRRSLTTLVNSTLKGFVQTFYNIREGMSYAALASGIAPQCIFLNV